MKSNTSPLHAIRNAAIRTVRSAAALLASTVLSACSTTARYSRNAESRMYLGSESWSEPFSVQDGLAVYQRGAGPVVLLFPYPHAATSTPMIDSPLARLLEESGFRVLSFDPPGSYRSEQRPEVTMREMLECADRTLDAFGILEPVSVAGHSMGSFCALAYAIERPGRVRSLVLEGSLSGFPSSTRHGLPGKALRPGDPNYGLFVHGGLRIAFGLADMELMKRFLDFYESLLILDESRREPFPLKPGHGRDRVPVRARWTLNIFRRLDYAPRLGEVCCPTLILVGRGDLQTPLACAEELKAGIPGSRLIVFELSGHAPHMEEPEEVRKEIREFLGSVNS